METERTSTQEKRRQGGDIMLKLRDFAEFVKSTVTTAIAIVAVMSGSYNFVSDAIDDKIEDVAESIAQKTLEVFKVEDAAFELEKENYKFLTGKEDSIRKQNLELVLKYNEQIVEKYPDKQPMVHWAIDYYKENFVSRLN